MSKKLFYLQTVLGLIVINTGIYSNATAQIKVVWPFNVSDGDSHRNYVVPTSHHSGIFAGATDFNLPVNYPLLAVADGEIESVYSDIPDGSLRSIENLTPCNGSCPVQYNGKTYYSRYKLIQGEEKSIGFGRGEIGNYVTIRHKSEEGVPYWVSYFHLRPASETQIYLEPGDTVRAGSVIGQVGLTGYRTGAHAHIQAGTSLSDSGRIVESNEVDRNLLVFEDSTKANSNSNNQIIPKNCISQNQYEELKKVIKKDKIDKMNEFFSTNQDLNLDCYPEGQSHPLIHAAFEGREKTFHILLEQGADKNYRNPWGLTPVLAASAGKKSRDSVKILELLHEAGADFTVSDNAGRNAALWSASQINNEVAYYLDQVGVDFLATDKRGSNIADIFTSETRRRGYSPADMALWDLPRIIRKYKISPSGNAYVHENLTDDQVREYDARVKKENEERAKKREFQEMARNPNSYKCEETEFVNLTENESVAMLYAVKEDLEKNGISFGKQCIKKISAKTKVPFRGNTLVSYRVDLFYPFGYKANCLELEDNAIDNLSNQWDWDVFEQVTAGGCNAFSGALEGKPIEIGGSRYFEGETQI